MAFRSRRRAFVRAPRKRAIWVNIPFAAVAFTESAGAQLLLTAEDWEAQFTSLANERAVLRAIVGEIYITQTVAVTTGGTPAFWGIYMTDANVTTTPVFTTVGMSEWDWLKTGVIAGNVTITGALVNTRQLVIPIAIKAKRRMTSQDEIRIVAQFGSDPGSPAGTINGLLRFLVARD